ncbi:exonuclease mut-7 homolog isoform X1 [Entelurus aequoreus]|uniref:exonuclease mut-7 homolog isoform X1 n=1 Tax=Entelurus aequoreus TaxID=161455 RepID=UPI002B1CEC0C|nr:exonuclease mut-7 homolog isoform X1 [Entelurus aequoreus]
MSDTTPKAKGLDPDQLRDQITQLWSHLDLQTLHSTAKEGFSNLQNHPLDAFLTILESSPGKQKGRSHTLGPHILKEFQSWLQEHPEVTLDSLPKMEVTALQSRALHVLTDAQASLVEGLINIYQLTTLDPATLRRFVMNLLSLHCYKEAALLGAKLNLREQLNMEEICVPLIVQDKLSLAENYVLGHPSLQRELVLLLDSWCHPCFSVEDLIKKRFPQLSVSRRCLTQLQSKHLKKHVFRLAEKFHIHQGLCPNALHKSRQDTLRFLMYKRFVEKSMNDLVWADHVETVVADDPELHIQLVEMLVKYTLVKSAQWSRRYNIPKHRLPFGVWDAQEGLAAELLPSTHSAQTEEWTPSEEHRQNFYQLPLSRDKVHHVDTLEALAACRKTLLQKGAVVGVDMEWQPTFGCSRQHVALIQLATWDTVFLLDMCAEGFWDHSETVGFIRSFFSAQNVLKLSYDIAGDLKYLRSTCPQFQEDPLKIEAMLDLLHVQKMIKRNNKVNVTHSPSDKSEHKKGLSLLVQQVLGKHLDKSEQMSNWEKRPLRVSQIRYAVADAYSLLEVYSVLSRKPADFGLPDDLRSVAASQLETLKNGGAKQTDGNEEERNHADNKEECQGAPRVSPPCSDTENGLLCGTGLPPPPPLHPQQLRVVCDNMLQGLGKYLRCLGVDAVILNNDDDHREAAKVAQAENRVILTCGQPYQTLRSQVGTGRCLCLDRAEKGRDQAVRVLKHFNVQPTPEDVFSRCQACNGNEYSVVPKPDMMRMLRQKGLLQEEDASLASPQDEEEPLDDSHELPRYAAQCRWASLSELDPVTLSFPGGAPLQLHTLPLPLMPQVSHYYVCTQCGKVFWKGSHFKRLLSTFQEVLHVTE